MKIIKVEKIRENKEKYNWHFTIDNQKKEIIIPEEEIDEIISDYFRRYTNLSR